MVVFFSQISVAKLVMSSKAASGELKAPTLAMQICFLLYCIETRGSRSARSFTHSFAPSKMFDHVDPSRLAPRFDCAFFAACGVGRTSNSMRSLCTRPAINRGVLLSSGHFA